jgi:hypothetical protein
MAAASGSSRAIARHGQASDSGTAVMATDMAANIGRTGLVFDQTPWQRRQHGDHGHGQPLKVLAWLPRSSLGAKLRIIEHDSGCPPPVQAMPYPQLTRVCMPSPSTAIQGRN